MTDWHPYSKETQLGRSERRKYRRHVASPKQWQAIRAAKCADTPCRICGATWFNPLESHHLIPRDQFGDDVADNIVGLCRDCHRGVELREPRHCRLMLSRLTDDEYAYAVGRGGEDFAERIYRIEYDRGGDAA